MNEITLIPGAMYVIIDRVEERDYLYTGFFQEQHDNLYTFVNVLYQQPRPARSMQHFDRMEFSSTTYDFFLNCEFIVGQPYMIKPKVQREFYYIGYYQENNGDYSWTFYNVTYS